MKIKKIYELNELKKNINFSKKLFTVDICEYYCFICQNSKEALFFIKDNQSQNKNMFDYVNNNLILNKDCETFLFNYSNDFTNNSFYLKSWFYVNGYSSLEVVDNLSGNLEEYILKDRAKISRIFFNNYNKEIKNYSFTLLNMCIPIYKKMTSIGLHIEEFADVYYTNNKKFIDSNGIFHPPFN